MSESAKTMNEEDVIRYLRENPSFFLRKDELLSEMILPHESGTATSLLERQVDVLRDRNMDMRHRLSSLLDNAKANDRLFEKTKSLILRMIEAHDLDQLVTCVEDSLLSDFGVDFCTLTVFGQPDKHPGSKAHIIELHEARDSISSLLDHGKAVCGVLRYQELDFLFGQVSRQVGSSAVNPLFAAYPVGILAIGSKDPDYYRSSMGTMFLNYVSEALNRLLPRHLATDVKRPV